MNQTKIIVHSVTFCLALFVATAFGAEQKGGTDNVAKEDADFVKEAASGGMMEVQLGKTAQEKSAKSQVKEFGRRMQTDHTKANNELKKLAAKKKITLPNELESKHKSIVDKITKLKGDEFDREYMSTMVDDHKEDIEKFQKEADNGKDADVKKFAQDHLPILKKHLALAEQTQKQISGKGK